MKYLSELVSIFFNVFLLFFKFKLVIILKILINDLLSFLFLKFLFNLFYVCVKILVKLKLEILLFFNWDNNEFMNVFDILNFLFKVFKFLIFFDKRFLSLDFLIFLNILLFVLIILKIKFVNFLFSWFFFEILLKRFDVKLLIIFWMLLFWSVKCNSLLIDLVFL